MGKLILIVDDLVFICQMLSFILKFVGYEVDEVVDGKEGFGKVQSKSYSLVFIDQNMLNMDGLLLICSLCNLVGYCSVLIFMLIIELSDVMKQQGCSVGVIGWLVKLFDLLKLFEVMCKVLF